jgi:hypothetical protein
MLPGLKAPLASWAQHPYGKTDRTRYRVNIPSRNCRKVAGSDTVKRAWVGPLLTLMVSKRGATEFKHALVGEVIAGTEGHFGIIVLLQNRRAIGRSLRAVRCAASIHLATGQPR